MKKIIIKGTIEVKTGLHIGGTDSFSVIGGVDSRVITNPLTNNPIIPGSSLKGKLRYLLSLSLNGSSVDIEKELKETYRLFGLSTNNNKVRGRLIFSDLELIADPKTPFQEYIEVKTENSIDRKTITANPRQLERVIKGSKFPLLITYNIEKDDEVIDDLKNIITSFELLIADYLGKGGTRGNGRINIHGLNVEILDEELGKIYKEKIDFLLKDFDLFTEKFYGKNN
jgi:CRISPR-associated protein Csm3